MADDPNQIPDQNLTPPSEPIPTEETKSEEVPQKPNPEITNPTDTNTSTQEPKPEEPTVTPAVSIAPATNLFIPQLHYPFSGTFAVTFSFGAKSDNEEIKKKFTEWGITGHNAEVNKVIGISGKTGAAFGEHLHLAIKPNNPDVNNGYLGFIDPSSYLSLPSQKEEPKEETKQEGQKSEETQQQPTEEVPPPIKLEPEKPVEQKEEPQQPETPQNPQAGDEEIQRQVEEKLKTELDLRRQKANEARQTKREENLMRIEKLIEEKKQINNDDVRELLHISQSTATVYHY